MRESYCNLAADDGHAVCMSLSLLRALTGTQVVGYASADEFLQRGDLNRVGGPSLDHHMPHVTGWELAARPRAGG
jgi:FixJ family two-component response regulator